MAKPTKRCRAKVPPSEACLKSPDPKKLRKAAKALKSPAGPASASTASASSPPSILKNGKGKDGVARQLSFASPRSHTIEAQNDAPMKPEAGVLLHATYTVWCDNYANPYSSPLVKGEAEEDGPPFGGLHT